MVVSLLISQRFNTSRTLTSVNDLNVYCSLSHIISLLLCPLLCVYTSCIDCQEKMKTLELCINVPVCVFILFMAISATRNYIIEHWRATHSHTSNLLQHSNTYSHASARLNAFVCSPSERVQESLLQWLNCCSCLLLLLFYYEVSGLERFYWMSLSKTTTTRTTQTSSIMLRFNSCMAWFPF